MKNHHAIMTLAVSLVLCGTVLSSGCSCSRKSELGTEVNMSAQSTLTDKQLAQGASSALQFDYKNTSELLIAKSDPATGDRWAARISRDGIPSVENEELWTIQMGPDSLGVGDRKAHGGFILHLLDTIRSLQVKETPVSGTPESFGLANPLYILRWKVSEPRSSNAASTTPGAVHAQVFKQYEIRLGSPVKAEDGSFQGLYASFGGLPGKTFVVQGAMLKMLDMITSFQALRLPTVATITSDDVDELEVKRPNKKQAFYAQRESSKWVDAKHQPISTLDVDGFLDQATHLRVLRFMDDAAELKKADAEIAHAPATVLTFKDRHGAATVLKLYPLSGGQKVYATFSTRKRQSTTPNGAKSAELAVFEVYPDLFKAITQL
jgi:hypothetical protein